jgi:hypothetical protein
VKAAKDVAMFKTGRWLIAGVVALTVLSTSSPALAFIPLSPHSRKIVTPGGKYVFVMLAPVSIEKDGKELMEVYSAEIQKIRNLYKQSGMYRNDGSTEPLWTVDWFAHYVETTSDGASLIRYGCGPWSALIFSTYSNRQITKTALDQEALSFFANGQLLKTYQICELIDDMEKLRPVGPFISWIREAELHEERSEYTVTTLDGNRFVFDVRTGEIISSSRRGLVTLWGRRVIYSVGTVVVVGGLAWFIRRWRLRRHVVKVT